ncbi:hypothetical protein SAMN05720606_102242 [Paenibacillus polysaccharolyticus]|uniref:Uncharacterized protein n=1 Tax=Paenibacillus polysaccharolyticus TaxID=582692 RepID=A0A1G5CX48_9BACL|nr:hypothetical protein SAMN05720606_102242 [Paenibacillus polysaccharolyticus]
MITKIYTQQKVVPEQVPLFAYHQFYIQVLHNRYRVEIIENLLVANGILRFICNWFKLFHIIFIKYISSLCIESYNDS